MPLNVAQLNIVVAADVASASANLQSLFNVISSGTGTADQATETMAQGFQDVQQQLETLAEVGDASIAALNEGFGTVVESVQTLGLQVVNMGEQFQEVMTANARSTGELATTGGAAGSALQGAFSGVGGALSGISLAMVAAGQSFGPLQGGLLLIGTMLRSIPADASAASVAIQGVAAGVAGLGVLATAAAAPVNQAMALLKQSIANTGNSIEDFSGQITEAEHRGESFGFSNAQVLGGLNRLTIGFKDPQKALQELGVTEDLAVTKHQSLETAATGLVRAYEGNTRALKDLGIQVTIIRNAEQGLTSAQNAQKSANDQLAGAQERLAAAQQKVSDRAQEQALAVNKVAQAQETLQNAQERLISLTQEQAAANDPNKISATETATKNLGNAQQQLADVQDRIAEKSQLSAAQQDQLKAAADRVAEAQNRLGEATGDQVVPAQNALTNALDSQKTLMDEMSAKSQVSLSDSVALRNAQDGITQAMQHLTASKEADAKAADPNSPANIAKAHEMRSAQEAVDKATQGVAQAHNDDAIQALKNRDANNQLIVAQHAVVNAQDNVAKAAGRVQDAQAKLVQQQQQGQNILDQVASRVQGAAKASADTWSGQINRMKADVEDWLAHFGNAGGRFATLALPIAFLLRGIGGGAAESIVPVAELGATAEVAGASVGGMLVPVALAAVVIAGIGLAFYEAYEKIKPFHDAVDDVGKFLQGAFKDAMADGERAFDNVRKAVDKLVDEALPKFKAIWKEITDFIDQHRTQIDNLGHAFQTLGDIVVFTARLMTTFVKPALDIVVGIFKGAFDLIYGAVRYAMDTAIGVFKTGLDLFLAVLAPILDLLNGDWSKAWDDFKKYVGKALDDVLNTIHEQGTILVTTIGKVGSDLMAGLWKGLQDAASNILDLPKLFDQWVIQPVKRFLGISSPSTVFMGIGGDIIAGLWQGISSAFSTMIGSFTGLLSQIPNALGNGLDLLLQTGANIVQGLENGVRNAWGGFESFMGQIVNGGLVSKVGGWLGINSPSKVFHDFGLSIVEGLTNGIRQTGPVDAAAKDLTTQLRAKFNQGVQGVGMQIATSLTAQPVPGLGQGVGAALAGGRTAAPQVNITQVVQGSVWKERELAQALRTQILNIGNQNGGVERWLGIKR